MKTCSCGEIPQKKAPLYQEGLGFRMGISPTRVVDSDYLTR